jgi:hypothetical protein
MKYIVFKHGCIEMPIVFNDFISHCQVQLDGWTPISAGFVNLHGAKPEVDMHMMSTSTELRPRAQDARLIYYAMHDFTSTFFMRPENDAPLCLVQSSDKPEDGTKIIKILEQKYHGRNNLRQTGQTHGFYYVDSLRKYVIQCKPSIFDVPIGCLVMTLDEYEQQL